MYSDEVNIHISNREGETKQGSQVDELGLFKINNRQARRSKWIHSEHRRGTSSRISDDEDEARISCDRVRRQQQQRFDVSKITST